MINHASVLVNFTHLGRCSCHPSGTSLTATLEAKPRVLRQKQLPRHASTSTVTAAAASSCHPPAMPSALRAAACSFRSS